MPQHDDKTVLDNFTLIRALWPDWVVTEDGREQLTWATFKDGHLEASCFIAEEVGGIEGFRAGILPILEKKWGFRPRIATIDAASVRAADLWIYRKPEEFDDNAAHVVICPSSGMSKTKYGRQAAGLKDRATLSEKESEG